jgi:hypothetical protein
LESQEKSGIIQNELRDLMAPHMSETNPFFLTISSTRGYESSTAMRNMINTSEEFAKPGTVAEQFSNLHLSKFNRLPSIAYLIRACDYDLERAEGNSEKVKTLSEVKVKATALFNSICGELEAEVNYRIIPIRDLVALQLESGLLVMDYIDRG